MVDVPSAKAFGFRLTLDEVAMRNALNSDQIRGVVETVATDVQYDVAEHVRATTSARHAANYIASLGREMTDSDTLGFDFEGRYALGNRPAAQVGIPSGRGTDPSAKPPLMTEAETHALSSIKGVTVDGFGGEDVT